MDEQAVSAVGRNWSGTRTSPWTKYLLTLAATCVALFATYSGALAVLYQTGHLPPPPIVNELCADVKLEWLRDNPPDEPGLLLVGSSVAWRNIDSEQFVQRKPSARPLNGGFCNLQVNRAGFVAGYLLGHLPSVRTVIAVVSPYDLRFCSRFPGPLFDPRAADGYVFERRWAYPFYVSHFDPVSLVRNARVIRALRDARHTTETLEITRYGDGPMDVTGDAASLRYGEIEPYDPTCFASLRNLAETVTSSGRSLVVATSPLHPAWSARFDRDRRRRRELVAGIQSALQGTGAGFWDGDSAFAGEPSEFTDAIHLNWTATHRFTALLAAALDAGQDRP